MLLITFCVKDITQGIVIHQLNPPIWQSYTWLVQIASNLHLLNKLSKQLYTITLWTNKNYLPYTLPCLPNMSANSSLMTLSFKPPIKSRHRCASGSTLLHVNWSRFLRAALSASSLDMLNYFLWYLEGKKFVRS